MGAKNLTLFSGLLAFVVVALGAWTRLADAGLGCPDWPGCYGFATIPNSPEEIDIANARFPSTPYEVAKAIPEVVHRYFAATLGFLILCIFFLINKTRDISKSSKNLSTLIVIWVIIQGAFGYVTVSLKLWPQIVTLHLLFGFLTTVYLWILYFKLKEEALPDLKFKTPLGLNKLLSWALVFVLFQIFLGAWTSTNYAAYACPDFPLCQGKLLPEIDVQGGFNLFQGIGPNYLGGVMDLESRTAIHFSHRVGALLLSLYLSGLIYLIYKKGFETEAKILSLFLLLQLSLGVSNVIFSLPLLVAVGHNIGGLVLLIYISLLRFR